MYKHRKRIQNRRRGALMVEFALTAPIFLLVVFASIEASRVHTITNAIQNACFEGARRGIVPGATSNQCQSVAADLMEIAGLNDVVVTVTPATFDPATREVTVQVDVPINAENGFGITGFFSGKTMSNEVTLPVQFSD